VRGDAPATLTPVEPTAFDKLVLCGLMGAGKSTVGAELAARLGWVLRDSDAEIEAATGETVAALAASRGVEAMHDLELAALVDALADRRACVVAAAASVADRPELATVLAGAGTVVVVLDATPEILAARFRSRHHRPTFGREPIDLLRDQAARRLAPLEAVATLVVDAGTAPPGVVAGSVIADLDALGRCPARAAGS